MSKTRPFTPRRRTDLRLLLIAGALFLGIGLWWMTLSHQAGRERERIIAEVPAFPTKGQKEREHPRRAEMPQPIAPTPQTVVAAPVPDGGPPRAAALPPPDQLVKQFLVNAAPEGMAGTIHVNALMNAPILDRLDKCFPKDEIRAAAADGGPDLTRDIDQIAFSDKGEMMTGFFDDEGAKALTRCRDSSGERTYRGFRILDCANGGSMAMMPSMALRSRKSIEELVDQTLNAPKAGASTEDVYGDIYMHGGLSHDDQDEEHEQKDALDRLLTAAFQQTSSVTFRANVWDSVALSVEAQPTEGQSADDLAATTNAALAIVKNSVDPEDIRLTAYTDLAKVQSQNGQLQMNLALPTEKLVEEMNDFCDREKRAAEERRARLEAAPPDDDSEEEKPTAEAAQEEGDP